MKFILSALIFLTFSLSMHAQIAVGMYNNAGAVSFMENQQISVDVRVFVNRDLENIPFEVDGLYNFQVNDRFTPFIGAGLQIQPFIEGDVNVGLYLPGGFKVKPFESFQQFSLLFEIAPGVSSNNDGYIRGLWGVRYTFAEKE